MQEFFLFAAFVLVAGCLILALSPQRPFYIKKTKCSRQPHLDCPLTVQMTERGGISSEGHMQCCKVISQVKAMNKAFCQMKPGVDYNGMSISESVHKKALAKKEFYENLDDSGPLGYKKKENESVPKHNNEN